MIELPIAFVTGAFMNLATKPSAASDGEEQTSVLKARVRQLEAEKEALQQELSEHARYRSMMEALMRFIPEGITIAEGPDANIVWVSDYGRSMSGRPPETIEGIPAADHVQKWGLFKPDGSPAMGEELPLTRASREGEIVSGEEWVLVRPDGSALTILCNAGPVLDSSGERTGGVIAWRDITERKRSELALREQQKFTESLIESAPTITYVYDIAESRNAYISGQSLMTLGYTAEEVQAMGSNVLPFLLHPEDVAHVKARFEAILAATGDEIFELEYRMRRKDGEYVWLFSRDRIIRRDAEGRPLQILGVALDVTERRRSEDALRRSNEDLERFAHTVSHDLQEPLRMVMAYSQLLVRRYGEKLDTDAERCLGNITDGARRMHNLIHDLLKFASVAESEEAPAEVLDSTAALGEALSNLSVQAEESSAVITWANLPRVVCRQAHLVQVFQNLLSNAMKYRREGIRPEVQISARRDGAWWVFSVQDNGQGIAKEHQPRIFGLFTRLHDRTVSGSGIGLATVKRIIEGSGRRIWVESEPGEGSTFYFSLPAGAEGVC